MSDKLTFRSQLKVSVNEKGAVVAVAASAQLDMDGASRLLDVYVSGVGYWEWLITSPFEREDFLSVQEAETWLQQLKEGIGEALDKDNGRFGVLVSEEVPTCAC